MEKGTWGDVPDRPMTKDEQRHLEAVKQGLINRNANTLNPKVDHKLFNLLRSLCVKWRLIEWDSKNGLYVLTNPKRYKTPEWLLKELADIAKAATKKETITAKDVGKISSVDVL